MSNTINTYHLGGASPYTILQLLRERPGSKDSLPKIPETTTTAGFFSSKTTSAEIPAIQFKENLSAKDTEAREKGFQLVAHMEHLAQNDGEFHRWLQIGFDQVETGEVVTFDEDGWKEK